MNKLPYSSHVALEGQLRNKKAAKIVTIISEYINLTECKVLDIGTGSGHIANGIAQKAREVHSVNISDERVIAEGYHFQIVNSETLPFLNESFDVVVSNHVIEHLPNHQLHLSEIYRVLKPNGLLYLATPNKYALMEPHFRLPFLSWLPRKWANSYTQRFRKKEWDIYPLTRNYIRKLTNDNFTIDWWSLRIVKDLQKFQINAHPIIRGVFDYLPMSVLKLTAPIIPTFVGVLKKK
ncbi:MAG: methyltransferase domain-containing protein [Saprospiraceae bacterium]